MALAMIEARFAIPGDLALPTGGYGYARCVLQRFPLGNVRLQHLALAGSFPDASAADIAEAAARLGALAADTVILFDGLAYGAMPAAAIAGLRQPIVALVHHPLGFEAGLSAPRQQQLIALEQAALALARRVIVTSAATARTLTQQFAVPGNKLTVAAPGREPAAPARGRPPPLRPAP